MQAVLELKKRHDIFYTLYQLFKKTKDKLILDIVLEKMEPFVFALVSNKLVKDFRQNTKDIKFFTKVREVSNEDFPDDKFTCLSECTEILPDLLSSKVLDVFNNIGDSIELIHFSDQFPHKAHKQILRFVFYLPTNPQEMENHRTLLTMAMYFIDHVSTVGLTSETKKKAAERRALAQAEEAKEKAEERQEAQRKKQDEKRKKEDERLKKLTPEQLAKEEARMRKKESKRNSKMKVVFG